MAENVTGNKAVQAKKTPVVALTEANLTKWVKDENKGMRFIMEQTGEAKDTIITMLNKLGLKTRSMRESASRKALKTGDIVSVYNAINAGASTPETIVEATGLSEDVVTHAITKMKRDGTITMVLAIARTKAAANAAANANSQVAPMA